jgi:DNA polymerase-1
VTRTILIDGDVITYTAASAVEREYDWGDDLWTLHSDVGEAQKKATDSIEALTEKLKADHVVMAFSDVVNFRKSFFPDYKGNRKDKRKPLALKELKAWIGERYETWVRPGLEGDDVLGILSTHPKMFPGEKIIVSIDKDFKTIPGYFFNPDKDTQPQFIDEKTADHWHMMQTLMGDATDGYPGCPGIGPKTAEKILTRGSDDPRTPWERVVETYEDKGLTEEDALTQARCARILRYSDYNFKTKEPILWHPAQ